MTGPRLLLLSTTLSLLLPSLSVSPVKIDNDLSTLINWREEAREMIYHSYDSYMKHGFPWDEVQPLSCQGRRWDQRSRGEASFLYLIPAGVN
jgi:hypothetical protein